MSPDSPSVWRKLGAHAQSILEGALDAVVTMDERGVVLGWNAQAEQVFGWKRDEAVGKKLADFLIPERYREAHVAGLRKFLKSGEGAVINTRFETHGLHRDGREVPVELTVLPERVHPGWIFTAFIRDITQRKSTEAALRESEQRFRNAFNHAGVGMAIVGTDGRFIDANGNLAAMLGYPHEELLALRFADITHADDRAESLELAKRLVSGEIDSAQLEKRYLRKDGRMIWAVLSTSLLRGADGKPLYFISQVQDTTPRREAEAALRESEEKFRSAFQHAGIGMVLVSPDGRFLQVNPLFAQMLESSPGEVVGKRVEEVTHPQEREETRLLMKRLLDGRASVETTARFVTSGGGEVWGHLSASLIRDAAGAPRYFVAQVQDITRRKQAEEALRISEKTYRNLFENHPSPMWVRDRETLAFLAVNDAAVAKYGYTRAEFRTMTIRDVRPAEDVAKLMEHLREEKSAVDQGEWRHRRKDGSVFWVEVTSHPIRFEGRDAVLAELRDLTDRKRAEEALRQKESQLQQAAKMEAIGRLAGGIAHDFNNLLTIISGFGQLLAKKLAKGEAAGSELEEIRYAATRGSSLTQQLLAFSRRQVLRPKALELNALVANMDQLLRRVIGENIELVASLDPKLGAVEADPGQLDQVIMNLALNARDAMPQGGRLTIETRNTPAADMAGGPWVMLAVHDTGQGMDAATMSHIFEPFFTTKEPGRGTGLGLATVYGIVQQSGGQIRVSSDVGRGSTFRIYLPRAASPAPAVDGAPAAGPTRGTETILVVEDEFRVRQLTARMLKDCGYQVLEASNGLEALQALERATGTVHLVVTDVVMPRMSGIELADRIRLRSPSPRVLLISGYADASVARAGGLPAGSHFMSKPFTEESLARRVREVLDGGNGHGENS